MTQADKQSPKTKGGYRPGSGRPAGSPNKSTAAAREAIAAFVDNNTPRLQEWLEKVADGVQDAEGKYIVRPDPEKAFTMVKELIEYHVPKLSRQEVSGVDGTAIKLEQVRRVIVDPTNGRS